MSHFWIKYTWSDIFIVLYILSIMLCECLCDDNKMFYMEGSSCERSEPSIISGAVVQSHSGRTREEPYSDSIDCRITFMATYNNWKLMLRMEELDIPDVSFGKICNDALYVYDGNDVIFAKPIKQAGSNNGLCGRKLPDIIYSTGSFLTVYFRTDISGQKGSGFKFVITAYNDSDEEHSCNKETLYQCNSGKCIDKDLVCDNTNHCPDYTDELMETGPECAKRNYSIVTKFLSLGITAAIAITVGSVVVVIICVVCVVCCCCKCLKKEPPDQVGGNGSLKAGVGGGGGSGSCHTTATHVTINNGAPHGPPMGHSPYHNPYVQQGYYPLPPAQSGTGVYAPYTCHQRESYSQGSHYSSSNHGPTSPPYRPYTPTSSRSERSHRSDNSSSVKYSHDNEKVALPAHV